MSKIKVVQIAMVSDDSGTYSEYLDDKGRVWYDGGHIENISSQFGGTRKWVTEWKQIDLPEEPGEIK